MPERPSADWSVTPDARQQGSGKHTIVLGSRSPRRRELLALLIPAEQILVLPPVSDEEPGFDGLTRWSDIRSQLKHIARHKAAGVEARLRSPAAGDPPVPPGTAILCADTVIAANPALRPDRMPAGVRAIDDFGTRHPDCPDEWVVLGQPPESRDAESSVRHWFTEYLAGRAHIASTAVCLMDSAGTRHERLVCTEVIFRPDVPDLVDWYLSTGEYRGKAGGYAIQGAGSVLVSQVRGSLSNVIGLPLEAVRELLPPGMAD